LEPVEGLLGENERHLMTRFGVLIMVVAVLFSGFGQQSLAAEPKPIALWKNGAPGAPPTKRQDEPVMLLKRPASAATKTAVIVIPGGGYGMVMMSYEGVDIADWLNSLGVTAFVLKYRMHGTGHMHPVPMLDGQRAIRNVRARAAEWNIDPSRIGVIGFSAGGHLASTLGTHVDDGNRASSDPIERVSSRPDFMILCYPVISFEAPFSHHGSSDNLLGKSSDAKLLHAFSNETQVTKKTPPTFIFQTSEDPAVPAENAVAFYLALHKVGVPVEMHIFEKGRHGVGLAKDIPGTKEWPNLCRDWLKGRGLLNKTNDQKDDR
jgi:acetyl esterase/lipase